MPDQEFDAEYDAHMLSEAAKIQADPTRLIAAQGAATRLKKEKEAEAEALGKVGKDIYDHPTSVADRENRKKGAQRELIRSMK